MENIYATSGNHSLLRNGKIPVIGRVHELNKHYTHKGDKKIVKTLEFDFEGNGCKDLFFFIDNVLQFHSISMCSDPFMTQGYKEVLEFPKIDFDNFLKAVVDVYVNYKMGFIQGEFT